MQLNDAVQISGVRTTNDGYLVADARIARTGIQEYAGSEVGKPELDTVRVWRPEAEVFSTDTMASYAHRPVTNDHPAEAVTARNWKRVAVGATGDDVARDGGFVRVPMVVMDQAAIDDIQAGKRELSAGYTCDLKWESGQTDTGEAYDAIQTNIRGNHLAIVRAGRAGNQCRFGDQAPIHEGDRHMALKTIIVDGLPVETTDAGEAAINKLRGMLDTSAKALETAQAEHTRAIAAKDAELGAKDGEITKLKAEAITADKLDGLVGERAAVVGLALALDSKFDPKGKTNVEVKRASVAAKLGDAAVKDKSDDYVAGLFDSITADLRAAGNQGAGGDPLRDALGDQRRTTTDSQAAYNGYTDHLQHAWKGGAGQNKGA